MEQNIYLDKEKLENAISSLDELALSLDVNGLRDKIKKFK